MIPLGISAFYHDSAVAILRDDEIIFALQEERLSRKKADERFPRLAIKSAMDYINKMNLLTRTREKSPAQTAPFSLCLLRPQRLATLNLLCRFA